MNSMYQAVPRAEVTGKVWSTRWCYRKKGPKQVRARFVVRQFANTLDANFYSPTPGLEVTRVLLAMALSKDLTILFRDISVAFMNTPMPEGDPVYVEPPEGLYDHNDTIWCLKRALNGLRTLLDSSHEHFAAVLTSRLGFTRSEAQPTLFVDLARKVFIAMHVDDLIMVDSSSLLSEVVGEMKQYFTMKVTHPLSASSTQTSEVFGKHFVGLYSWSTMSSSFVSHSVGSLSHCESFHCSCICMAQDPCLVTFVLFAPHFIHMSSTSA